MGFGQAVDNMNNNYSRMLSPSNWKMALSNFSTYTLGHLDRLKRMKIEFSKDKIDTSKSSIAHDAVIGSATSGGSIAGAIGGIIGGAIGGHAARKMMGIKEGGKMPKDFAQFGYKKHELKCLRYMKFAQQYSVQLLQALENPRNSRLTQDDLDKIEDKLSELFDKADDENLISTVKNRKEVLERINQLIAIATDVNSYPQNYIRRGFIALDNYRKKANAAKGPLEKLAKENLKKVEAVFDVWMKHKNYAYRLMNWDIRDFSTLTERLWVDIHKSIYYGNLGYK